MTLPINLTIWLIAMFPIVLLLVLMVGFHWGASKAAPAGLLAAALSSIIFFRADITVISAEMLKALWNSLNVILVIFTAILMYEVSNEAKAFKVLKNSMQSIAPNELLRIIGIGVVFASFLQGVTGFGVPVAVTAPLLIGIGVKPLWAVIIPLIGHSWAGTFGTLAIAWLALITQSGITDPALINQTALFAAGFIWILNATAIVLICWFYAGKKGIKKGLPAIIVISFAQGAGQLVFSQINQVLACFVPSCIAIVAFFFLTKSRFYRDKWKDENSPLMLRTSENLEEKTDKIVMSQQKTNKTEMSLHQAFIPYYIMTVLTLLVLLTPAVNSFLGQVSIAPDFKETITGYGFINPAVQAYSPLKPFTHASVFLFLSAVIGFLYYSRNGHLKQNSGNSIIKRAVKKTVPSSLAVISLIMMSRIMGGTGQTTVLALGTAGTLGRYYSGITPFIGLLGSFMTGSNMSSNILFADFQLTTSRLLSLNPAAILGAHTAGAAIGTSIAPGNIVLGTTTAGILGEEGKVLKKLIPIALSVAAVFGILLFISQIILRI